MKNMEQPNLENLVDKSRCEDEQLFNDTNKDTIEKHDRTTADIDKEITSNTGSTNIGKFKSIDSLYKAYNSLQAEFTKKSQRLSELEGEIAPLTKREKIDAVVEDMGKIYTINDAIKTRLKDSLCLTDSDDYQKLAEQNLIKLLAENVVSPEDMVKNEEFVSNYILKNSEIKNAIIKQYVSELKSAPSIKVATNFNSSIPTTPPSITKTINEAGNIALSIIKKN